MLRASLTVAGTIAVAFAVAPPADACTNPYQDQISAVIPADGAVDVPRDVVVTVRYENRLIDYSSGETGQLPPFDLTLTDTVTGAAVPATVRQEDYEGKGSRGMGALQLVPAQPLEPNRTYRIDELGEHSFTTGAELDTFTPSFTGASNLALQEIPQMSYEWCEGLGVGMCPSEIATRWTYPVHARASFTPIEHPVYGTAAYRYTLMEVDVGGERPAIDRVVDDVSDGLISVEHMTYDKVCHRVIAHDIYGNVFDDGQVLCATKADVVRAARQPELPGTKGMRCNPDTAQWEPISPGSSTTPGSSGIDSPDPNAGQPNSDDPALAKRGGCAVGVADHDGPGIAWLLALGIGLGLLRGRRRRARATI